MSKQPLKIYFAGELFDHKHLIGNKLLADHLEKQSQFQYKCILPQEFESASGRSTDIRNQDLYLLMTSDLALFNFDGHDLDSGTVVEFIIAKMLDIPSVVLRTDFRSAGDQEAGDPWNLMCSHYPRTKNVLKNGIEWYQTHLKKHDNRDDCLASLYEELANDLLKAFEEVMAESSVLVNSKIPIEQLYEWAIMFPGSGFMNKCRDVDIHQLISAKKLKGVI